MLDSKAVIVLDLDEVLFPFMKNFIDWYNKKEHTNHSLKSVTKYNLSDSWPITKEEVNQNVLQFSREKDLMKTQPITGAIDSIRALQTKYDLVIVTARNKDMKENTQKWLDKWFPNTFSQVYYTGHFFDQTQKNKARYCTQVKAKAIIDDSISNCNECLILENLKVYLFGNYPWNQTESLDPRITRLKDWPSVLEALI